MSPIFEDFETGWVTAGHLGLAILLSCLLFHCLCVLARFSLALRLLSSIRIVQSQLYHHCNDKLFLFKQTQLIAGRVEFGGRRRLENRG